jgi:methyltransferase-like protein
MDFVRNRTFRRTLVVASEVVPDRSIDAERIRPMRLSSALAPPAEGCDLSSTEPVVFEHRVSGNVTIESPVQKAALEVLHEHWPTYIPFDELVESAAERMGGNAPNAAEVELEIAGVILTCFPVGMIEISRHPPRFVIEPSEKPEVPGFSRYLARERRPVTNLRHEVSQVDELQRQAITLADGNRDRAGILDGIAAAVLEQGISLVSDGEQTSEPAQVRQMLDEALPGILRALGRKALLKA